MAYANAVSSSGRAAAIVALMRSKRVAVEMFGDSNMGQATGDHWSSWLFALRARNINNWGTRVGCDSYAGYGSDVRSLGIVPGNYENFAQVTTGDDSEVLNRSLFTAAERATPPANQYPDGWVRYIFKLASGQTSPAAGTITGNAQLYITPATLHLGDLQANACQVQHSYFIPATGGGTLRPAIRGSGGTAFTLYTAASPKTSPTGAVTDYALAMAATAGTDQRQFQHNRIGVDQSSGIVYSWPSQLTLPSKTNGIAVSPVFSRGGSTLRHIVGDMVYALAARPKSLQEQLRIGVRGCTAGQEACIIVNKMKGNDVGDSGTAWVYSASTATQTGSASNTQTGYSQNFTTFARMWIDAWAALGYPAGNLWIVDAAYHPQPVSAGSFTATQQLFHDAVRSLASSQSWASQVIAVDGNKLTTDAEMTSLAWYKGADTGHLSTAGFDGFNSREIEAIFTAATGAAKRLHIINPDGLAAV